MPLSEKALANDANQMIEEVEVAKIYLDAEFNCRGRFGPHECIDLARDIAERGLQQPVIVRPLRHETRGQLKSEEHLLKQGFTHVMIAGHRRLTAYKINEGKTIPAIIKDEYLDNFEACDINAIENLQRKELNLAQEAKSIKHYWLAGWTREDTADRINMSSGWVQIRFMLLAMPDEVMEIAEQGYLTSGDVRELNKEKDPKILLKKLGLIRDARKKGEKGVVARIKKAPKRSTKKSRKRSEIFEMMETIREAMANGAVSEIRLDKVFSEQGNSLATRALAWAAGEITELEMHLSIQAQAKLLGKEYELPEFTSE